MNENLQELSTKPEIKLVQAFLIGYGKAIDSVILSNGEGVLCYSVNPDEGMITQLLYCSRNNALSNNRIPLRTRSKCGVGGHSFPSLFLRTGWGVSLKCILWCTFMRSATKIMGMVAEAVEKLAPTGGGRPPSRGVISSYRRRGGSGECCP